MYRKPSKRSKGARWLALMATCCITALAYSAQGGESGLHTAKDLYDQCAKGIGPNLAMKPAVDSVCAEFILDTYQWMLKNPEKVGELRPYAMTVPPLSIEDVARIIGGRYVNSMPFTEWYKRCPLVISARDAAISVIQHQLAVHSPDMAIPSWYVIPPGSPNFPSPPIEIKTVPWSPTACSTTDPKMYTASDQWGKECRDATQAANLQRQQQRQQIEAAKRSQCLPSATSQ